MNPGRREISRAEHVLRRKSRKEKTPWLYGPPPVAMSKDSPWCLCCRDSSLHVPPALCAGPCRLASKKDRAGLEQRSTEQNRKKQASPLSVGTKQIFR